MTPEVVECLAVVLLGTGPGGDQGPGTRGRPEAPWPAGGAGAHLELLDRRLRASRVTGTGGGLDDLGQGHVAARQFVGLSGPGGCGQGGP